MLSRTRAQALLDSFSQCRVLVFGDLMADEHVWGQAGRVSPEAPVLVIDVERETFVPGGAANVAHQLLVFGAQVSVAGVVGADANGEVLKSALREMGASVDAIVTADDRPTTTKTRIVAGPQQVVRVDREKRGPLTDATAEALLAATTAALAGCDALLFSDYNKGVLSRPIVEALVAAARAQGIKVITANPKPVSSMFYAGVDVAQFNRSEAEAISGGLHRFDAPQNEKTFHEAGAQLRDTLGIHNLLITRGSEGLTLFQPGDTYVDVAPHRVEVFDPAGAGDSTISGLTLALAAGATPDEAAALGNASGGAVVRRVGVVAATTAEVAALFAQDT